MQWEFFLCATLRNSFYFKIPTWVMNGVIIICYNSIDETD